MINNGYVAKMLPSQQMCKSIDMKIGPNLRWSLIQCSGGAEATYCEHYICQLS